MNLLITGFFLLVLLIFPGLSLAATAPVLLDPSNNSTVADSSPKLSWSFSDQCYASGSCFHVQVATSSSFASVSKDYYTNSVSYSPRLSLGQWFWRVKAKNSAAVWSDWGVSSFTIVSSPSPTPTPTPTTVSINLFDKATSSSKSVLPASTKSSLISSSPKSKEEKFLADREINFPEF